jgi:hypothetical protein
MRSVFPSTAMAAALDCPQSKIDEIHTVCCPSVAYADGLLFQKMFTIDTTSMRTVLQGQRSNGDALLPTVLAETAAVVQESVTAPSSDEHMQDIDLSQSDTISK